MKKPTISIVIPAFNEATRLTACLDSIALQTVPPEEVIVIDNNSTDSTAQVALGYDFVKVIRESRQGIVFARDAGFMAAAGDVIARIDADTQLSKTWVEQVKHHFSYNQGALTGSCYFYNVPAKAPARRITDFFVYRLSKLLTGHYPVWGSNMAITRQALNKVYDSLCHETMNHEDLDMGIHLYRADIPITFDKKLLADVEMRCGFSGLHATWRHLRQWPTVQREHNESGWVVSYCGALFLLCFFWVPVFGSWFEHSKVNRLFVLDRR